MIDVIEATFQDGVFKPDQRPSLAESTRVRLVVETLDEGSEQTRRDQAWSSLQRLWQTSQFDSQGDRLSRDQLHERR
jgi:predicted DNA-binding antitoxin AbrB/MazE fold protein